MRLGRLICVVGPSGVGKDSVISGIIAQRPDIRPVTRSITRAPDLGGEDYTPMMPAEFRAAAQTGAFCLHWQAHGLSYGIPAPVMRDVEQGAQRIANLSRRILSEAFEKFPSIIILNIVADADTLRARLVARGREDAGDISTRLERASGSIAPGLPVATICNNGPLDRTVRHALETLSRAEMPSGELQ